MLKFLAITTLFTVVGLGGTLSPGGFGKSSSSLARETRVVNGADITIEMAPWQVSLWNVSSERRSLDRFRCSGSIISSDWVVTAAHCVCHFKQPLVNSVSAGSSYLTIGSLYRIETVVCHPQYLYLEMPEIPIFDIALIKVSQPFVFGARQRPVDLQRKDETTLNHSTAIASGWGSTNESGHGLSQHLKAIRMNVWPKAKCDSFKLKTNVSLSDLGAQICAVGGRRGFICYGDSGGPLTLNGTLLGIASWINGKSCNQQSEPAVFTEIAPYVKWIRDTIGQSS